MDDSVQTTSRAFSGQTASVNENGNMSSVSNKHDTANVSDGNRIRRRAYTTSKSPYAFFLYVKHGFRYFLLENFTSG